MWKRLLIGTATVAYLLMIAIIVKIGLRSQRQPERATYGSFPRHCMSGWKVETNRDGHKSLDQIPRLWEEPPPDLISLHPHDRGLTKEELATNLLKMERNFGSQRGRNLRL
jgi:hypothetical protein